MKKVIGYLAANFCFYIGDLFCKISVIKHNGNFFFDKNKFLFVIGYWLACQYQNWMHYSSKIQDWAEIDSPWQKVNKS